MNIDSEEIVRRVFDWQQLGPLWGQAYEQLDTDLYDYLDDTLFEGLEMEFDSIWEDYDYR